jgi:hypothetical protein
MRQPVNQDLSYAENLNMVLRVSGQILAERLRMHEAAYIYCVLGEGRLAVLDFFYSTDIPSVTQCTMNCGCSVNAMALKEASRIGTGVCRLKEFYACIWPITPDCGFQQVVRNCGASRRRSNNHSSLLLHPKATLRSNQLPAGF